MSVGQKGLIKIIHSTNSEPYTFTLTRHQFERLAMLCFLRTRHHEVGRGVRVFLQKSQRGPGQLGQCLEHLHTDEEHQPQLQVRTLALVGV